MALVVAAPAAAAGSRLQIAQGRHQRLPDRASSPCTRRRGGKPPDLQLLENGVPASNAVPADPGAPAAIALLIDPSKSMTGQKLTDAIDAATALRGAQKDDLLGLYGFG